MWRDPPNIAGPRYKNVLPPLSGWERKRAVPNWSHSFGQRGIFSALIDDGHISEVRVAAGDSGRKTNQRKARMGDNITHFVNRCQMPGRSCWWVIPAPIATMAAVADRVIIEGDMTV